jgi:hypothetical protein
MRAHAQRAPVSADLWQRTPPAAPAYIRAHEARVATLTPQHRNVLDDLTAACAAAFCGKSAPSLQPAPAALERFLTDDISVQELTELLAAAGSFDWLSAEEEDIYSIEDGEAVEWPSP